MPDFDMHLLGSATSLSGLDLFPLSEYLFSLLRRWGVITVLRFMTCQKQEYYSAPVQYRIYGFNHVVILAPFLTGHHRRIIHFRSDSVQIAPAQLHSVCTVRQIRSGFHFGSLRASRWTYFSTVIVIIRGYIKKF